jgi:dTMP kinase
VESLAGLVHPDIRPDLTLLLDVPVAVGMSRVGSRGDAPDRFEQARADFLERVRASYLDQADREPERYAVIDASQTLDQVQAAITGVLEERLS